MLSFVLHLFKNTLHVKPGSYLLFSVLTSTVLGTQ